MRSKAGPIAMIVAGCLLALGPLWGLLGTVIGMVRAFNKIATPGTAPPEQLAGDIGLSIWATLAGLVMTPIGLGLLAWGIVLLDRIKRAARTRRSDLDAYRG